MKFKKTDSGKNRSSSSNPINFDDPARWKRTPSDCGESVQEHRLTPSILNSLFDSLDA
ncbi:hypothetical protein PTTG_30929, partial [Puccinia triticina 1-1 BBBD Race 1]